MDDTEDTEERPVPDNSVSSVVNEFRHYSTLARPCHNLRQYPESGANRCVQL
jgi:hypothetical protein